MKFQQMRESARICYSQYYGQENPQFSGFSIDNRFCFRKICSYAAICILTGAETVRPDWPDWTGPA